MISPEILIRREDRQGGELLPCGARGCAAVRYKRKAFHRAGVELRGAAHADPPGAACLARGAHGLGDRPGRGAEAGVMVWAPAWIWMVR